MKLQMQTDIPAGLPSGIPKDQLERITPIVEDLRAELGRLVAGLPPTAQSALTFTPEGDAAC